MVLLTSAVRVVEVGVQAFFQPFGNFFYILLVNVLHKTLQISLKIQTRIHGSTFLNHSHDRLHTISLCARVYLSVQFGQLFIIHVALCINPPLVTKL